MKNRPVDTLLEENISGMHSPFWRSTGQVASGISQAASGSAAATSRSFLRRMENLVAAIIPMESPEFEIEESVTIELPGATSGLSVVSGRGLLSGVQPAGSFFQMSGPPISGQKHPAPGYFLSWPENSDGWDDVRMISTGTRRLFKGVDYHVMDDGIWFIGGPPSDPGKKITLLCPGRVSYLMWTLHGYPVFNKRRASERFGKMLSALKSCLVSGQGENLIACYIASCAGLPFTMKEEEIVISVVPWGGGKMVVTNRAAHAVPGGVTIHPGVVPGAIIPEWTPLSSGSKCDFSWRNPDWWTSLDGLMVSSGDLSPEYGRGPFFFENRQARVQSRMSGENRLVKFEVLPRRAGNTFWKGVRSRESGSGDYLSGYIQDEFVNPAGFVAESVLQGSVVSARVSSVGNIPVSEISEGLSILKKIIPVGMRLIASLDLHFTSVYRHDMTGSVEGIRSHSSSIPNTGIGILPKAGILSIRGQTIQTA